MNLAEVSDAGSELSWALAAFAVCPSALGGLWLRAPHGPVREHLLPLIREAVQPCVRIPAHVDDERLMGGLDVSATLQTGRSVWQSGLLSQAAGGVVLLSMAERLDRSLVARLLQAHEQQDLQRRGFGMVALDESLDDEATIPMALAERLGLWLDLREWSVREMIVSEFDESDVQRARSLWRGVTLEDAQVQALCQAAQALGVDSLRVPQMAARLACILAALQGRETVQDQDVSRAARWVLAPRATQYPVDEAEPGPADEVPPAPESLTDGPPGEAPGTPQDEMPALDEVVLQAAMAAIPEQLLDRLRLAQGSPRGPGSQGQQGALRSSAHRGRPLAPRPGKPHQGARMHVLATLRAAIPRQKLRPPPASGMRLVIRAEDFHVRRHAQQSATCLIFAVDASGSAAMHRLAEAKGAVELLLHQSYARRDQVSVLSFRAGSAQVLLAPTRSLVRAKRALSALPAGGGTPLASALRLALEMALQQTRQGVTPLLVVLSDGRANVNLQGIGGREEAQRDARAMALAWAQHGLTALWLDTSAQPEPLARQWASLMQAGYLPMPHASSQRMADAMQSVRQTAA